MKRPECKVKSCTDEKPTGSCLRYSEGYAAAQAQAESFAHWKYLEGRREERAAIVAWLFEPKPNNTMAGELLLANMADSIARADHLRPDIKDGEGKT